MYTVYTQFHMGSHEHYNKCSIHCAEVCQQESCWSQTGCNLMQYHCEWSSDIFWTQHKSRRTTARCPTPVSPAAHTHTTLQLTSSWYLVQWWFNQKVCILVFIWLDRWVAMYCGLIFMIDSMWCRKCLVKLATSRIWSQQPQLHIQCQTHPCTSSHHSQMK